MQSYSIVSKVSFCFSHFFWFGLVLLCLHYINENNTTMTEITLSLRFHVLCTYLSVFVFKRVFGGKRLCARVYVLLCIICVRIESSRCDVLAGGNDKAILDFRQASVNRINYWSELESLPLAWKENEKEIWYVLLCVMCALCAMCACICVCASNGIVYIYIDISSCYTDGVTMSSPRAVLLTIKCVGAVTFG